MGDHPGNDGHGDHDLALDRFDRHVCISGVADLYGRKPALIWAILGYSIFTGLTGFSTGWISLLIFSSITRIALAGENPVGMLMVTETAPTKWRATALGGLVGGYPFGYMLCSLAALVVVPLWGWRSLYFLGILP